MSAMELFELFELSKCVLNNLGPTIMSQRITVVGSGGIYGLWLASTIVNSQENTIVLKASRKYFEGVSRCK